MGSDADAIEWDRLTAALNDWGVLHVAPGAKRPPGPRFAARWLFAALFASHQPRLHQASVAFLLTHPRWADAGREAIARLDGPLKDRAMRRYVAAAAMQRMARTRLAMRFGPRPLIPAAYLDELGLPPLDEEFGRAALIELANQEEARYGYDARGTYLALLDLLLAEMRRPDWGVTCETEPIENG